MLDVAPGYVYVMTTKIYPNLVKIGMTTRTPEERTRELSSETGSLNSQEVEHSVYTANCASQRPCSSFPVPIPANVWLFGTDIIGLIGSSKRRKAA